MQELLNQTIQNDDAGTRLDVYISTNVNSCSRTFVRRLSDDDCVLINEMPAKPSYRLKVGDHVHVMAPDPKPSTVVPEDIELDIVYEDEYLLIVNKPKGMVVHPSNGNYEHTLVNALLHHCRDSLSDIGGVIRPGIVHRIDKDTSGLLVVAKTNEVHQGLSELFSRHDIERTYFALAEDTFDMARGTIDAPIGRNTNDRMKMAVNTKNGKRAVTHFEVLENFSKNAYLKLNLETGRTHQIRVHLSYIKHPIVGDEVYGRRKQRFANTQGQVLHAGILGFVHPITGKLLHFESDLPDYFEDILTTLRLESSSQHIILP